MSEGLLEVEERRSRAAHVNAVFREMGRKITGNRLSVSQFLSCVMIFVVIRQQQEQEQEQEQEQQQQQQVSAAAAAAGAAITMLAAAALQPDC